MKLLHVVLIVVLFIGYVYSQTRELEDLGKIGNVRVRPGDEVKSATERIYLASQTIQDTVQIDPQQLKEQLKRLEVHIQLNQQRLNQLKQDISNFANSIGMTKAEAEAFFETTLPVSVVR